jgi:hypothetical protein
MTQAAESKGKTARPKVFGVGFHKTGTKSLAAALTLLGYRVGGSFGVHDPGIARHALTRALRRCEKYDAFQDNPWPVLFRELDERVPGSRFILTLRPEAGWIESAVRHFGRRSTPMRQWIYGAGYPAGNEERYLERFRRHNREVMEHFRNRPGDLLVIDFFAGDGWDKLCGFLGVPVPRQDFPHVNAGRTE